LVAFHDDESQTAIGADVDGGWIVSRRVCPNCRKFILMLLNGKPSYNPFGHLVGVGPLYSQVLIRPKGATRPCPSEVPPDLSEDYREACIVAADSPKASAALSRRCLQCLLRTYAKVTPDNLAAEIQEVIDSNKLPSHLSGDIDAIRNIGNFSAHPMKSQSTGQILPVEPGEAEWNLDVLEGLFDFYFVQPEIAKKKRAALNKKLDDAGKPPMK
jgi:hypothetical protein